MTNHQPNSPQLSSSLGNTENLKLDLHLKFIRYIDLFCTFCLILKKKLSIYNKNSQSYLLNSLNVVLNHKNDDFTGISSSILQYIINSKWSYVFNHFSYKIEEKFSIRPTRFVDLEPLSINDFIICSKSLGRYAFGLCSVIKGSYTKCDHFESEPVIIESNLEIIIKKNKDVKTLNCEKCLNLHKPLVGIVSPFVLSIHNEYSPHTSPLAKKQKISEELSHDQNEFETNESLYSGHFYPLENEFNEKIQENCSNGNENDSITLSDMIFDLVSLIIENSDDGSKFTSEIFALATILRDNIKKNEVEDFDELTGLFGSSVTQKLVDNYRDKFEKVANLKPFPTTYWLVDKELIKKASKLEGLGSIKNIQNFIDSLVSEYDKEKGHEQELFITSLIKENLGYILKRFKLTHPTLIELMYNILVNSNIFLTDFNKSSSNSTIQKYIYLKDGHDRNGKKKEDCEDYLLVKSLSILNTLRTHGVAGTKQFLHIKCLHTRLALEIAEGSRIGSLISKLI